MKSIFEAATQEELLKRIDQLSPNSKRKWGKMTVGQMLWHCQYPLKLVIENKKTEKKGNFLIQLLFKKSMYNDEPWRKNLPTSPQLKAKEEKDFTEEHQKLRELVVKAFETKNRETWHPHPIFGALTKAQWGQMSYKHLDHHLTQFGV